MTPKSVLQRAIPAALFAAGIFAPNSFAPARAASPDPKAISYTLPENIEWRKGPTSDTATIQGDPSKPGIYVQLIKWHPGNMSRPHSHSTARYIMVLSGTWWIGTGDKYDPDSTFAVKAGTYVVDQPNELHYDGAKDEECVLYLVGTGPMTTTQAVRPDSK